MKNVFLHGFTAGMRQWRIAAIVYIIQLCLALTLGMQVYEVLKASIGNSLEIHKLLRQYDHTVLTDFLNVHGASITPLIGQLRWLLLVWLLFSVFINGGLLACAAAPQQASWHLFWQGGAVYFTPFLKIGLLFLTLALGWTAVVWLPAAACLEPALEYFRSEATVVWGVALLLGVWLLGLGVLFGWSALSRLQRVQTGGSIRTCLRNGGRLFRQNKTRFLCLLAGFTGLQLLLTTGYWLLEAWSGMTSPMGIVMFFGLQQAFVFCRILIRQMLYSGMAMLE